MSHRVDMMALAGLACILDLASSFPTMPALAGCVFITAGFGMVGGAMRSRRSKIMICFA